MRSVPAAVAALIVAQPATHTAFASPLYWDRIALQVAASHGLSLTENAHLFALLNLAMADGGIAVFDAKYRYLFWRPVTAIREADTDGNPSTDPEPAWTPWLDYFAPGTPAHPEYPSAHATLSGAAAFLLASTFGDDTPFTVTSNVFVGTRSFSSFSAGSSGDSRCPRLRRHSLPDLL